MYLLASTNWTRHLPGLDELFHSFAVAEPGLKAMVFWATKIVENHKFGTLFHVIHLRLLHINFKNL